MARKRRRTQRLKVVNPDCAGIDIGKDRHFVAVDPERCSEPVRSFDGFTRDLEAMAAWLSSCGVKKVAMESTSVYWIPVYKVLERAGFEVMLVPPRMTKQIAGRKSDVLDCQWIWQLQSYGLLRGAFRPGDAICPLRSYVRQAKRLIEDRSRCVQHMQKALTQMNVLLDSVLADITGQTGQKILRAIIDGERDPQRLASFRHRRVKASADTIAASLEGTWREEHLFALEQAMQRYDFLEQQLEGLRGTDHRADRQPDAAGRFHRRWYGRRDPGRCGLPHHCVEDLPGHQVGRLEREGDVSSAARDDGRRSHRDPTIGVNTALVIASEIGPDFSAFPSVQHFCSWLGVAPGTRISGGKPLPGRAHKVVNPVAQALRMAAMTARSSPDLHRRQAPRTPRPKGQARRDHCHGARACLPDLPDDHPGRGICGARYGDLRATPPQPLIRASGPTSQATRLPTGPDR